MKGERGGAEEGNSETDGVQVGTIGRDMFSLSISKSYQIEVGRGRGKKWAYGKGRLRDCHLLNNQWCL